MITCIGPRLLSSLRPLYCSAHVELSAAMNFGIRAARNPSSDAHSAVRARRRVSRIGT